MLKEEEQEGEDEWVKSGEKAQFLGKEKGKDGFFFFNLFLIVK